MREFKRQQKTSTAIPEIDFGAAAAKIAEIFPPDEYRLRIESAKVIQKNANVLVAFDLVEVDSGKRVATAPSWVDGPNAGAGNLTAENQHIIARLLKLANLPTAGNVGVLIPKLAGLEFDGHLALSVDTRTGRSFNTIDVVYVEADAS